MYLKNTKKAKRLESAGEGGVGGCWNCKEEDSGWVSLTMPLLSNLNLSRVLRLEKEDLVETVVGIAIILFLSENQHT